MLQRQFGLVAGILLPIGKDNVERVSKMAGCTANLDGKCLEIGIEHVRRHAQHKANLALILTTYLGPPLTAPFVPAFTQIDQEGSHLIARATNLGEHPLRATLLRGIKIGELRTL